MSQFVLVVSVSGALGLTKSCWNKCVVWNVNMGFNAFLKQDYQRSVTQYLITYPQGTKIVTVLEKLGIPNSGEKEF